MQLLTYLLLVATESKIKRLMEDEFGLTSKVKEQVRSNFLIIWFATLSLFADILKDFQNFLGRVG